MTTNPAPGCGDVRCGGHDVPCACERVAAARNRLWREKLAWTHSRNGNEIVRRPQIALTVLADVAVTPPVTELGESAAMTESVTHSASGENGHD